MIFIPDSSFFIAIISELEEIKLLKRILDIENNRIILTKEVYNEIKDTKNSDQLMSLIQNKIIILKKKINNQDFENYCRENYTLNIGELSVIYIGNELKITTQDYYCIIDEKKARKLSKEENLKLCGTIGFLEYLLNLNLISKNEFKNYLKILKLKGFRLPKAYNKL